MDTAQKKLANDLYMKIWRCIMANRFDQAQGLLPELFRVAPYWPESTFTRGYLSLRRKNYPLAAKDFHYTLTQRPDHLSADACNTLCRLHLGETREALSRAKALLRSEHQDPIFWHALSEVFQICDELEDYLRICKHLTELLPNNANMLANLSEAYRFVGDYDAAEETINRALVLSHDNPVMLYKRSQIRKQTPEQNHISELRTALDRSMPWNMEMQICYALAKELEDIGKSEESFSFLERGSQLRRQHSNYDVEGDISAMELIIDTYTEDVCNNLTAGFNSEEPLFIMGLPRTGTTLLERILSAHSDVFAAGELHNFSSELVKQLNDSGNKKSVSKLEAIPLSLKMDWKNLGESYINSTRPRTGHVKKFIDKMPINYLYLGLIATALPKAKIIVLDRDPMDACYAIYKTLFDQAYPFSYSQEDLGNYYVAWKKMMDHWCSCFPEQTLRILYEDLVCDTEITAKKAVAFCGLEWEDACLNFHTLESGVSTASASQVRQPVYQSSIGKWKNYEKQLCTLRSILHDNGID